MQKNPPISFLIVNYKSRDALTRCLHDLQEIAVGSAYEILIANNDSIRLTCESDFVRIIHIGKNIGFGAAHNILADEAQYEVLCLLNPDTHSFDDNFTDLANILREEKNVGIVAPQILNTDNSPQAWSLGDKLTPWSIIKTNCGMYKKPWEKVDRQSVDWVSGGAFLITKSLFHSQKGFDEQFFLYFEDVDLCTRIRNDGHTIIWEPRSQLIHVSGGSSEDASVQKKHYFASQKKYLTKHCHITAAHVIDGIRRIIKPL